jgi:hypothetical protein
MMRSCISAIRCRVPTEERMSVPTYAWYTYSAINRFMERHQHIARKGSIGVCLSRVRGNSHARF